MLHTLVEAGAWLWRLTTDFAHSVIVLREARGVKYGSFMEPGRQMVVTVELTAQEDGLATFKGKGEAEGQLTVAARLTLAGYNLCDRNPALKEVDERIVRQLRSLRAVLQNELAARR